MSNHLISLLQHWYPKRDATEWVLGTVYKTEGPCYRKPGAMMLFNGLGQQFGMLSGGCLESDIQTHARRVMQQQQTVTLCYDGSDEDDLSFQLGIGCGGTVHILLQPITAENKYLQLDQVYQALVSRQAGYYHQRIEGSTAHTEGCFEPLDDFPQRTKAQLQQRDGTDWLLTPIQPPPHLLVVGGGIDARPVVSIAAQLGWQITIWDPRPANGRREFFPDATMVLRGDATELCRFAAKESVSAAILMSHNIGLDAAALKALNPAGLSYLALLGPLNRRAQVLTQAGLSEACLNAPMAGPAGLDIGAELPESIALAILTECHATLAGRDARSLALQAKQKAA